MARDRDLNTFIEDILKQAQSEVSTLKTQKSTLIINLKELEEKRNKLSQEILELSIQIEKTKRESKEKIDEMMNLAQDKLTKTTAKESEASGKVSELNIKLKEAENLIKSNEGLKNNLTKQNDEAKSKIENINKKIEAIREIAKDL